MALRGNSEVRGEETGSIATVPTTNIAGTVPQLKPGLLSEQDQACLPAHSLDIFSL